MDILPAPVPSADRIRDARRSTLLAAGTVGLFALYVALVHLLLPPRFDPVGPVIAHFGGDPGRAASMDLPRLYLALGALLTANLLLATTAGWWQHYRHVALGYVVFHAVVLTIALHFVAAPLGLFLVYGFVVVHPAVIRSRAACFATANLCAALYALLALWERHELAPELVGLPSAIRDAVQAQPLVHLSLAFLTLNCLAAFAAYYGGRLRGFADTLRRQVLARTADLQAANDRLAAAHAELEAVVHAIAHDVKTPIASIAMVARGAVARSDLDGAARQTLARIVELEAAAESLIGDLLSFFRATATHEEIAWVALGDVVTALAERLRPALEAKQLTLEIQGELPRLWMRRSQLEQVVGNLLGNAVKYTPCGRGPIVAGGRPRDADGIAAFWVADRGIGLSEQHRRSIFDLFWRAPADARCVDGADVDGSGVGLAIVDRIVRRHGGRVTVRSTRGEGSCFGVLLPCPAEEGD